MSSKFDSSELYLAHRGELLDYASKIVGDRSQAEDVVQEAYLRFGSAASQQIVSEPLSYLFRIVRNLSLDMRRRASRDLGRLTPFGPEDSLPDGLPSPELAVAGRQELRLLRAAMAELPEQQRIALEMHRFSGHTIREIAAHLDVSVGTAYALLKQSLEHCRRRLFRKDN